jgi:hypothetical protein
MEQNTESHLFELQLDQEATGYLGETARWGKFFAIIGFIGCGFIVILAFSIGALMSYSYDRMGAVGAAAAVPSGLLTVLYLGIAVLYFFPLLYLYRFSVKMLVALKNHDQPLLNQSLRNLKACYKFLGIMTIISIGLGLLAFIIGIISAAFH